MDKQLLGAFIAENRKRQAMTQRQLAQTLHVTDKAVSKWERGLSYPDVTLLEPLAAALGLTVGDLLCCVAPAQEKEQIMKDTMHTPENNALRAVVEMADDNRKRQHRKWFTGASAAIAALLLVIILMVIQHARININNPYRYTEEINGLIEQVERTADGTWLYVTDADGLYLLKLRCPAELDTSRLKSGWCYVNNTLAHPQYAIWYDRRTGEITRCNESPEYLTVTAVGSFSGSAAQPMAQPLFGYDETFSAHLDSNGITYFFAPVAEQPAMRQVLMVLPDAGRQIEYRVVDTDGDGINELLLTNLEGDMPYMLCDVDDAGQLTTRLYSTWE